MNVIIVDTETTHYRPDLAHVVEIGALVLDLETGRTSHSFEMLANPGEEHLVGAERALEISGITREEVLHARPSAEVADEFRSWMVDIDRLLIGYNSNHYDSVVLAKEPWRIDPRNWDRDMDVMLLAFEAMQEIEPCPLEWLAGRYGHKGKYKWPRLEEAARHYGVLQEEQDHRALSDCCVTAALLRKLVSEAE